MKRGDAAENAALLTRRKSSMMRRKSSMAAVVAGPVCERLAAVLQQTLGGSVDARDITCAQVHYRLLGSKRYWFRRVKQDQTRKQGWEAQCYEVCLRKSTKNAMRTAVHWQALPRLASADVQLKSLGHFDSERAATAAYDAAIATRNMVNPLTGALLQESELPVELTRTVQLTIASDRFRRLKQMERLLLVYELLLACDWSMKPGDDLPPLCSEAVPSQVRGITWIGANVARLVIWRGLCLNLVVCAKTPSQVLSSKTAVAPTDTERFGLGRLLNDRVANIDATMLPVSRGLADLVSPEQQQDNNPKQQRLPHFYHGLPEELKRMMADQQQQENPLAGLRKLGNNTEATFLKKYIKRRREYAVAARKLQQQYRRSMHSKALKRIFWRQYGALAMQRLLRGHRARQFARAYRQAATCAVLLIQSLYRGHVSRESTKRLRERMQAAAGTIQRVYRGSVARKYVRWVRQKKSSAIVLERVVRGFMARRRVARMRRAAYKRQVVVPACIQIQRVWRGLLARRIASEKRRIREQFLVIYPAASRLGRIIRGYLARRLALKYRRANAAARVIQTHWRSYRYYRKWMLVMEIRRQHRMASKIGALGRGYVARKFFKREKRKRFVQFVLQPAARNIQRVFRGYMVRRRHEDLRDQVEAAITLQQMWRSRSKIKLIQERMRGFRVSLRHKHAIVIQCAFRCFRARRQLVYRQLSYQARYGTAALAIQSAWRSFCSRVQIKEFRFCSMIERKAQALTEWKTEREMIEFDLLDARDDLKRLVKYKGKAMTRIKDLKSMRIEWERRQPVVDKELSTLTEEDKDRGWGEAFETEKHFLHYSLELSVEDILSHKERVREYEAEIEDLRLELDDLERDLEECVLSETTELETYRVFERQRADAMFAADKLTKVRRQRIRWKVRSDRRHVVRRHRDDLKLIEKEQLAKRQVQELGVLSYAKKQELQVKMAETIERVAVDRAKQNNVALAMQGSESVLRGFDDIIRNMHSITQEATFDYRMPKTDLREQADTPMCWHCGRITCDCEALEAEKAAAALANKDQQANGKKLDVVLNDQAAKLKHGNRLAKRGHYHDR